MLGFLEAGTNQNTRLTMSDNNPPPICNQMLYLIDMSVLLVLLQLPIKKRTPRTYIWCTKTMRLLRTS